MMSEDEDEDHEVYFGEQEDPEDEDAPAYFDKDGFGLAGKSFISLEKNRISCLALL